MSLRCEAGETACSGRSCREVAGEGICPLFEIASLLSDVSNRVRNAAWQFCRSRVPKVLVVFSRASARIRLVGGFPAYGGHNMMLQLLLEK
jgi:hypothetical protein